MPNRPLLPPASQLAKLTNEQTASVITASDNANRREHSYALTGLVCGTLSFLALMLALCT